MTAQTILVAPDVICSNSNLLVKVAAQVLVLVCELSIRNQPDYSSVGVKEDCRRNRATKNGVSRFPAVASIAAIFACGGACLLWTPRLSEKKQSYARD
jgi:hypothetical protein